MLVCLFVLTFISFSRFVSPIHWKQCDQVPVNDAHVLLWTKSCTRNIVRIIRWLFTWKFCAPTLPCSLRRNGLGTGRAHTHTHTRCCTYTSLLLAQEWTRHWTGTHTHTHTRCCTYTPVLLAQEWTRHWTGNTISTPSTALSRCVCVCMFVYVYMCVCV